ncbi:ABC transporter permease subunit [Aquihabitans daechungensis]|uniref:ABC transporter permease subunit n=1 Tax=Aquihabitans daechungensis TaxID=1052257 RepID=UPI003BA39E31
MTTVEARSTARRDREHIDWDAVRAIMRRDLAAVGRSKAVVLPMLLVPFLMLVLLPMSVAISARGSNWDVTQFLDMIPARLADPVSRAPENEQLIILVLGYLVAPLFLIVPLMVSAVLAGDAFAGEKERKTLETVLHLPVRDKDLYIGKLLVGFLPSVAVSWIGFLLFCIVSNVAAWPIMHRLFMPTKLWALMILWIAPAVAALGLGIMVRVSVRVNNTQEAQQLGGAVVLPLVILAVGQTTALMLAGLWPTFLAGAVLWVVAIWLNIRGSRNFTRDAMAARL